MMPWTAENWRRHWKKTALMILAGGVLAPAWGQIGGITGGKLFTPDAVTLSAGVFEFEPAYELQGYDREAGYRFSLGFGKLEAGVSLVNTAANQAVGLKYSLIPDRLAITSGVEYDTTFHHFAAGILYSHQFSERLSTDVFAVATPQNEWTIMTAAGYFVTDLLQPIVEIAVGDNGQSSASYGFTFAANENVLVGIGVEQPLDDGRLRLMSVAFTFSM